MKPEPPDTTRWSSGIRRPGRSWGPWGPKNHRKNGSFRNWSCMSSEPCDLRTDVFVTLTTASFASSAMSAKLGVRAAPPGPDGAVQHRCGLARLPQLRRVELAADDIPNTMLTPTTARSAAKPSLRFISRTSIPSILVKFSSTGWRCPPGSRGEQIGQSTAQPVRRHWFLQDSIDAEQARLLAHSVVEERRDQDAARPAFLPPDLRQNERPSSRHLYRGERSTGPGPAIGEGTPVGPPPDVGSPPSEQLSVAFENGGSSRGRGS